MTAIEETMKFIEEFDGEFTQDEMADEMCLSVPTISIACRKLIDKGILAYRREPHANVYFAGKMDGKAPTVLDQAVTFIEGTGGEFTVDAIAEQLGFSVATVAKACKILIDKGILSYRKRGRAKVFFHGKMGVVHKATPNKPVETKQTPVKKQFEMIAHITNMVLDGTAPSFLLTGMAGIGKTYAVRQELSERDLTKDVDYQWISGKASPMGLYRVLHNNRDGIIIFDDCDDVLKNPSSMNILKSALDLYKIRVISWPSKAVSDAGMDEHFEFSGQVIFISNLDFSSVHDALTSRAFKVDVYLTPEQVIEKINLIIEDIKPNGFDMPMEYKRDALAALLEIKDEVIALGKNVDIRAFEKACLLRQSATDDNWEEIKSMIKYQI